jgi:hypothetical protein
MKWALPDVAVAAAAMRDVRANPSAARARAADLGVSIRTAYSLDRVGQMAADRLVELADARRRVATRPACFERGPEPPPVPIPAAWYDEDYFEHGVTSNWAGGYSWASYGGLFCDVAAFLIEVFPESYSFLDAGCAKGFLVRALREAGRECWGIDHSPWALAHAETAARPFLIEGRVEDVAFDRNVDVLVAFDLLSQLTEDRALAFLRRARDWTRTAIVAAMPSFESAEEAARATPNGRDRTHITMRTRPWWHERFIEAGWRQDPLQRLGAERLREHPLPRKMRWHLYSYAPK